MSNTDLIKPCRIRRCPHCDKFTPLSSDLYGPRPPITEDTIVLCIHCLELSIFNADLKLRKATVADAVKIASVGKLRLIYDARAQWRCMRN